jgi:glucose-1-phosphate adenylyltransferase
MVVLITRVCTCRLLHTATGGLPTPRDVLVVTGQDVFSINFRDVLNAHRRSDADITLITNSADAVAAQQMGTCRINFVTDMLEDFRERPEEAELGRFYLRSNHATEVKPYECSTGMYVFKVDALEQLLGSDAGDDLTVIGRHVMPAALRQGMKVQAWHHDGRISVSFLDGWQCFVYTVSVHRA